jgi:hypothetical protein
VEPFGHEAVPSTEHEARLASLGHKASDEAGRPAVIPLRAPCFVLRRRCFALRASRFVLRPKGNGVSGDERLIAGGDDRVGDGTGVAADEDH